MGNLWRIIQAHIDTYGVREAEIARRIGSTPQTINSWKNRGIKKVPSTRILRRLATLTNTPYPIVYLAASLDAENVTAEEADVMSRAFRWTGTE